ncbi:MAG: COX15/CtaA family protein [Proteobacteria bacterium]|nr:COX15/CtaA family protein [Pseudomonadota bacterium]
MNKLFFYRLTTIALVLAFVVIILGAYTRLTHAGLGCPDWPGCYGQVTVPETSQAIQEAKKLFPGAPLETRKAWNEMVHRYAAGLLGLMILLINITALINYKRQRLIVLPGLLLLVVIGQAALGMWTVTLKLLPLVVMGHLVGGFTLFILLGLLRLQLTEKFRYSIPYSASYLYGSPALIGVFILIAQIILGGWVSANYAGISCVGFPKCNGVWWPVMHLKEALNFFAPIGANYQGGLLESGARVTIQMMHRLGAVVTLLYLGWYSLWVWKTAKSRYLKHTGQIIFVLLLVQIGLGIINVTYMLPLWNALAHNAVAALLLLTLSQLTFNLLAKPKFESQSSF